MKRKVAALFLALAVVLSLGLMAGCSTDNTTENETPATTPKDNSGTSTGENEGTGYGAAGARADESLTVEEMLIYAIQDEYLAHAEYVYILDVFGEQNPFSNIVRAEEKHIAELKTLFDEYNIIVPVDVADGHIVIPASVKEALETGVQAEIDNIAMYEDFLGHELPDDVRSTFTSLRDASKSHLTAFQRNLDRSD